MKLRLQSNSIRLRLKRAEIDQLAATGRVEEKIVFGQGEDRVFLYVLEASALAVGISAHITNAGIHVSLPLDAAVKWATGNDIGIDVTLPAGAQELRVLIEKDFACLNGPEDENVDTFPNPLAGTKC